MFSPGRLCVKQFRMSTKARAPPARLCIRSLCPAGQDTLNLNSAISTTNRNTNKKSRDWANATKLNKKIHSKQT